MRQQHGNGRKCVPSAFLLNLALQCVAQLPLLPQNEAVRTDEYG
jgi:hypothetical protein